MGISLFIASAEGHDKIVKLLTTSGADVDKSKTTDGATVRKKDEYIVSFVVILGGIAITTRFYLKEL